MTEAALRLIADQMVADVEFARWVRADPARALRDFDLTAEERDRLLRINTQRDASNDRRGREADKP